jgi:hypothetical protein
MAGSVAGFEVRAASEHDGPRMAELDRLAFGAAGMGHYGESHVRCWREVNPEGLLVASRDGTAVACCYSQYVDFSPEDVSALTTDAAFTDSALTRKTHRPDGNSIHVVTVSSIVSGGRRALFEALLRQLVVQNRAYLILFSRLSGLRDYCQMLMRKGVDVDSLGLERIAPWYVAQCAALFGGARLWPGVKHESLALPPPAAPDPVLNKYLKDRGAEVAAVLIDWIEDPASCACSALVAIRNPKDRYPLVHGPDLVTRTVAGRDHGRRAVARARCLRSEAQIGVER